MRPDSFPDEDSGTPKSIKAKKAVILATGGFGNDVRFRSIQDPRLTGEVESTNRQGATAEALMEAMRIGAVPVQLSWIQLGPWASPDERMYGVGPLFATYVAFPYGVMVDPSTGRRIVNEMADRKTRAATQGGSDLICYRQTQVLQLGIRPQICERQDGH